MESTELTNKQLKKKLNCDEIAPNVLIVNTQWLIDCVGKSSHLSECHYPIKIVDDNISNDQRVVGEKQPASSSSSKLCSANNDSDKIGKKLKKDSSSSCFSSVPNSGRHPIIPNPIYFPDFIPIFDSWQEYRSVMYKFRKPSGSGILLF